MIEPDLAWLYKRCSNVGRWGPDDERGTLNLITAAKRAEAARLVTEGRTVPLGRALKTEPSRVNRSPAVHRMLFAGHAPYMCHDAVEFAPHGYAVTHLDAPGHVFFDGLIWNGRDAAAVVTSAGLQFGSIRAFNDGVFTRGVLLDIAAARGVAWLADDDDVTPADLDLAEELAGVSVSPGDAIIVRIGLASREAVLGEEDPTRRAGLTSECLMWIKDRDVAVYSGDCVERRPSPYPTYPLPVHMIGMAAMGLVFLDNLAVEALRDTCRELDRWSFLLTCAPVVLDGATGSPVNPLAVF
jgi:kynurenine formamidase